MSDDNSIILAASNICMESRLAYLGQATVVEKLVHDVSFTLRKGRVLGIVGESGSGKSLTAKALMGIFAAGIHLTKGTVNFKGENLPVTNGDFMQKIRGKHISMLFQDPLSAFNPLHRIGRQIGETLALHTKCSAQEINIKTLDLLQKLGLKDAERIAQAFPHELSGGQRQRAMLAMSLIAEPDVLIADEPTTALDAAIQLQVVELLRSVKDMVSLIIISHDLMMMRSLADDLCVMQEGKVVEEGRAQSIFTAPQHAYSKMLLRRPCDVDTVPVQQDIHAPVVLAARDVNVAYKLGKAWFWQKQAFHLAVKQATFTLKQGECLGIVGESGSGKTSLGLALLRLIASQGDIDFMGINLQGMKSKDLRDIRQKLQVVFQDPLAALNPRLSVYDCIAEGLRAHGTLSEQEIAAKVRQAMQEVELDPDIVHRYPHEFSGGQCQRICIARALIMQPTCIVFDEPTSSLDRNTQFQIIKLIKGLQERLRLACIFITHDLVLVRSLCHSIIVMQHGEIVEYNKTETIFQHPEKQYTKLLIEASQM